MSINSIENATRYSNELDKMDGAVPANILMISSNQYKINLNEVKNIFANEN